MNIKANLDLDLSIGDRPNAARAGSPSRRLFELHAWPCSGPIDVVRFSGREAVSALFSFDITFLTELEWREIQASLLGQPVTLAMHSDGVPSRLVHGIAAELSVLGERLVQDTRLRECHMRLVPRMWLLKKRCGSRVFQEMTVLDVVSTVLREAGVPFRWATTGSFSKRAYCLQYEETDYAFVRRVLAEEGIYFYFEHPSELPLANVAAETAFHLSGSIGSSVGNQVRDGIAAADSSVVVFGNAPTSYLPIPEGTGRGDSTSPPSIMYRERGAALRADEEAVHAFSMRSAVRTNAVELRDYDFQKPALKLVGCASLGAEAVVALSVMPAGASGPSGTALGPKLEAYDHRGDYEEPDAANPTAAIHLEQHRADVEVGHGASSVRRLAPGYLFALTEHPQNALNEAFVVTKVRHVGATVEAAATEYSYKNSFDCAPAATAIRPRRPRPRVRQILEPAVVTGPQGEEIHTDRFGRIKVQFRWDREGKYNEHSSCWIRVPQPWAGASWGFQFIPRVGMEVLIGFLGGDADRPVVMGAAYNGTHPPPFPLPQHKTRSGIRTQSTPGGEGHNEISFEDALGGEQVYVHAQRDLVERVRHDHDAQVDHDESLHVRGQRLVAVGGDSTSRVGGEYHREVHGRSVHKLEGDAVAHVKGSSEHHVERDLTTRVDGRERRYVQQPIELRAGDDTTLRVAGCLTTLVGRHDARRSSLLHVEGESRFSSASATEITSEEGVVIRCGESSIRMTAKSIELRAPSVFVRGAALRLQGESLEASMNETAIVKCDKIALRSTGAALALDAHAQLASASVSLSSDPTAIDTAIASAKKIVPTEIALRGADGKPVPNQRYILTFEDGSQISGFVGADGIDKLELEKPAKITWPDARGR